MRSNRMLMGAALISCVAATTMPGAYAQEANTSNHFNARASGQQPSTAGQPRPSMHHGQGAGMNAQGQTADMNAQSNTPASNRASTNGQFERRGFANEGRLNASTRERRGYAEAGGMRGERGTYGRMSEERYGQLAAPASAGAAIRFIANLK